MSHPLLSTRLALRRKLVAIETKVKELEALLLEAPPDQLSEVQQSYYRCTTRLREIRSQLQEH